MDMQEILGLRADDFDGIDFAESSDDSDGEQPSSSAGPLIAPVPLLSTNDSKIVSGRKGNSESINGGRASTPPGAGAAGGDPVGRSGNFSATTIMVSKITVNITVCTRQ